jgi:predicted TIM-barrel fold metal-dependent hydrolase
MNSQITFFDSNVCVGKRGLKHRLDLWRTEDVLKIMRQCGVAGGLVYSGLGKDYSPKYGNDRLVNELQKSERLFGCYVVLPNQPGDFYEPEDMIKDLRKKKMVAARMFPRTHRYIPDERTMGAIYSVLERARIPLFVDASEISMQELASILERHENLNVILGGLSWSYERMLFPLMDNFSNLHVDFSALQSNRIIEVMYEKYGADRLIFGSGMPMKSLGAGRALIDYSEIPPEAKKKIAGGNLSRLTGVTPPPAEEIENDFIAREASEGKPMSVFVFDSHAHFLEEGGNCGTGRMMIGGDIHNMVKLNDLIGVDRYCVAPWLGIWTDSEAGNEEVLKMSRQYPGKVCGYVLIDSNYVENVEAEARKYHLEYKIPGVKMLYARTGVRYNDPVFDPWWRIANENNLFALMDCGSYPTFLSDVEKLAIKYPNVSFFLDHAGRSFAAAEENAFYAKKYPNIYLQLTYTTVTQGVIEYLCKEGLSDKVLYGTDAPMRDPRPQLGWVVYADISIEDKKKILGENMQRILERCFK